MTNTEFIIWISVLVLLLVGVLTMVMLSRKKRKEERKATDKAVIDKCMRELSNANTIITGILEELHTSHDTRYESFNKIKQDISILSEELRTLEYGAAPFHAKQKLLTHEEVKKLTEYDRAIAEECEKLGTLIKEVKSSDKSEKGIEEAKTKIEKIKTTLKMRRDIISRAR